MLVAPRLRGVCRYLNIVVRLTKLVAHAYGEFVSYLELERGYTPATIQAYRSDGRVFMTFLEQNGHEQHVDEVKHYTTRQYIAWLRKRGLRSTSIARRLNSLRSFWKFVRDNEHTDRDPFLRISIPKRPGKLSVYLTAQECQRLLQAAECQRSIFQAFRDRAVLSVLIFTGIRRSELLDLKTTSVDLGAAMLRVTEGKGKKDRLLPLPERAVDALADWLELRPECNHEYLFTHPNGTRLSRKALAGIVKRAVKRAGIEGKHVTLHTVRHTFACLMLQSGCDLFSLSRFLGHTRLDTTAIYLHATVEDLRELVARDPLSAAQAW